MKYVVQIALIVIAFFSSWMAKKQFREAMEKGSYDIGLQYKLNSLTGENAVRMAKRGLFIARYAPWAITIVLLIYNLL